MPTSSVKMCISICVWLPITALPSNRSRAHSLGVLPARDAASSTAFASPAVSLVLRLQERRSRPRSLQLAASGGIRPDTAFLEDRAFSLVSAEAAKYLGSSLSGVKCQNSSGAKHRSCSATKLNARSRLHRSHRSRGLHPGNELLCRLLRRTIARAFTDTQSGSNLLGLRRLQKVLEVTVFREDIVERLVHNIVGGCVDEGGVLIDLRGGSFIQPNGSTDVAGLVDLK